MNKILDFTKRDSGHCGEAGYYKLSLTAEACLGIFRWLDQNRSLVTHRPGIQVLVLNLNHVKLGSRLWIIRIQRLLQPLSSVSLVTPATKWETSVRVELLDPSRDAQSVEECGIAILVRPRLTTISGRLHRLFFTACQKAITFYRPPSMSLRFFRLSQAHHAEHRFFCKAIHAVDSQKDRNVIAKLISLFQRDSSNDRGMLDNISVSHKCQMIELYEATAGM
jgi:hypothetical protein